MRQAAIGWWKEERSLDWRGLSIPWVVTCIRCWTDRDKYPYCALCSETLRCPIPFSELIEEMT